MLFIAMGAYGVVASGRFDQVPLIAWIALLLWVGVVLWISVRFSGFLKGQQKLARAFNGTLPKNATCVET